MNFIFTFLGWLAWNWFEFTQAKDIADDKGEIFDLKKYAYQKYDNWIWTLIIAFILLLIGNKELGMELVKHFDEDLEWSDLYYLGSGVFSEAVAYFVRIVRNKLKRKEDNSK